MKKILILGIDGYIGWALACRLSKYPYEYQLYGVDNLLRRRYVADYAESASITNIKTLNERSNYLMASSNFPQSIQMIDICSYSEISKLISKIIPDVIIHLAEQPSAPYSMRSPLSSILTQENNVLGTLAILWSMKNYCPDAHLIKLGTMGEYGTPNCDIPEGEIPPYPCASSEVNSLKCPMAGLQFPRSPGSFYHLSKVHDTYNIIFACRTWGLRSTDIMQGIVYGVNYWDGLENLTRLDYDQYFGTVINRFCAQVVCGHPITIYGSGSQTRGYLPLIDSINCLMLAIENPPAKGEYRTINQFQEIYSINQLVEKVKEAASKLGIKNVKTTNIPNPRVEDESHYYNPDRRKLITYGYNPKSSSISEELSKLIETIYHFKQRIDPAVIMPTTKWR